MVELTVSIEYPDVYLTVLLLLIITEENDMVTGTRVILSNTSVSLSQVLSFQMCFLLSVGVSYHPIYSLNSVNNCTASKLHTGLS
jgi:hypothetical protein